VWDFVVLTSRYFWANWYIWLHTCILLFLLLFDEYSKLVVLLSCLHLVCVPLFIPHCFGWEGWEGWKCCWDLITTCFCFVAWSSFNLSCYSVSNARSHQVRFFLLGYAYICADFPKEYVLLCERTK
jgi:hypothetical protein